MNTPPDPGTPALPAHRRYESVASVWSDLENTLVCSEWCLIELMIANNLWVGPPPTAQPPPDYQTEGSLEYGVFLFLIKNPGKITISLDWEVIAALVAAALVLPPSNMTGPSYDNLSGQKLAAADGSMIGTEQFDLYDQYWVVALYNLIMTVTNANYYNNDILPVPALDTYEPVTITSQTGQNVIKVGLLGDWGTGGQAAAQVMSTLVAADPDCLIHLGDVYYSGAPQTDPTGDYTALGEEQDRLVSPWPSGYEGRSFALNSNHEMYCGAQGLFNDALLAQGTTFGAQNGYTMFALKVGDWTLLGLDSAYNGTSLDLFMYGNLGSAQNGNAVTQIQWIQKLKLDPAKTIVLTHHTGFDFDCSTATQSKFAPFWQQVRGALGGDPYAWYWGHVHNGIVYTNPVTIASSPAFTTNTYCRCLGHGGLPFGVATGLQVGANNVEWFATAREASMNGVDLVYNGCVGLAFVLDGQNNVTSITEFFMNTDPDPSPFVKRIFGTSDAAAETKFS